MHLPIHHVHYVGRMFFVPLHKFYDPWKLRRAEYTLNVRKALFCFFIQRCLERVQRKCLASICRISAVELWWRVLIPFLVLVNCQVWCFLVWTEISQSRLLALRRSRSYDVVWRLQEERRPMALVSLFSLGGSGWASGEAEAFFGLSASSA